MRPYVRLDEACRDLEIRLQRQERLARRLAAMHGLTIEELEAEESPGVRYDMPHTYAEFVTWCRLNGVDE
jgi:hypothetical protein